MLRIAVFCLPFTQSLMLFLLNFIPAAMSWGMAQSSIISPTLYNLDSGLSSNYIRGILQDKEGFIWIATAYGLNRYDGHNFRQYIYDSSNPWSISDNNIWTLYEDRSGRLWVGTQRGLDLFERDQQRFKHFYPLHSELDKEVPTLITAIFEDSEDHLWVGSSSGLFQLDWEKQSLIKFAIDSTSTDSPVQDNIISLYEDKELNLWAGTLASGLLCIPASRDRIRHYQAIAENSNALSANRVEDVFEDSLLRLWVKTSGGLDLYHPVDKTFSQYSINTSSSFQYEFEGIDRLLANLDEVISIYPKQNPKSSPLHHIRKISKLRSVKKSSSLVWRDRSDGLWVGLWGRGVAYISANHYHFRQLRPDHFKANVVDQFSGKSLFERKDGNIWLGTGNGLYLYERAKSQWHPIIAGNFHSILEDGHQKLWMGNYPQNLIQLDAGNPSYPVLQTFFPDYHSDKSILSGNISSFFEDSKGDIWIGSFHGLSRFRSSDRIFSHYRSEANNPATLSSNWIWCISEDNQGNIWIGTNKGLDLYNKENDTFTSFFADRKNTQGLSDDFVFFIYPAGKGKLWLATKGGINLFDPITNTAQNWQVKDGLPNNAVVGIIEDQKGYVWSSTMNGIGTTGYQPQRNSGFQKERWSSYQCFPGDCRHDDSKGGIDVWRYRWLCHVSSRQHPYFSCISYCRTD